MKTQSILNFIQPIAGTSVRHENAEYYEPFLVASKRMREASGRPTKALR